MRLLRKTMAAPERTALKWEQAWDAGQILSEEGAWAAAFYSSGHTELVEAVAMSPGVVDCSVPGIGLVYHDVMWVVA